MGLQRCHDRQQVIKLPRSWRETLWTNRATFCFPAGWISCRIFARSCIPLGAKNRHCADLTVLRLA
jgi:hypothetical protein